jgi:hypothetical protein
MWIVIGIFVAALCIGAVLDFLRLFGIHINDWTVIFWIVVVTAVVKWKTIARTLHYLFAKYPAQPTAPEGVGSAPTFQYESEAHAVRAIKDKLDADSEIAEATMRLERARMLLADAEQEAEEDRRRAARVGRLP